MGINFTKKRCHNRFKVNVVEKEKPGQIICDIFSIALFLNTLIPELTSGIFSPVTYSAIH